MIIVKPHFYKFLPFILVIFIFLQGLLISCATDNPSKILIKKVKSILEVVSTYNYGDSRSWLQEYNDIMTEVYNMPGVYGDVEKLMQNLLKSNVSNDAKILICKSLGTFGGNSSIPVLAEMLHNPETTHLALIAFTTIPGDEVDKTLLNFMQDANNDQLIGIINTLALRKCSTAIQPLSKYLNSENSGVATSSVMAIGKIAGEDAAVLLHEAFLASDGDHKWDIAEGIIKSVEDSSPSVKGKYCQYIYDANPPISIKYAAFKGIFKGTDESEQPELLLKTLNSSDPEFQEALIPLIRNLPGNAKMDDFIKSIASFHVVIQAEILLAISDRKDRSIHPLAIQWVQTSDPEKRLTGLKCLKNVSESGDIQLLASIASNYSGKEKELARSCLYWMEGEDVNSSVLNALKNSRVEIKPELIRCVGYRKIDEGNELVLGYLQSANTLIRREAIETLGKIGTKDELKNMLDWVINQATKSDIELIVNAVTTISLNFEVQDEAIKLLDEMLGNATNELPQRILIEVLGNIGGDQAYRIIQPYVSGNNKNLQFTVLKVLSSWENDTPLSDLEAIIQTELPQRNRSQAIAGITFLVLNSTRLNEDQKSSKLESAFSKTGADLDKKIIINGCSRIESLKALDFVIKQLKDQAIQSEVQDAVIRIAGNLRNNNEKEIDLRMDSLKQHIKSEDFKEKISILQQSMEL